MTMKKEMMSWLMTAMRQLVLPIVFCGACVCTSCSSDDDDKSPKEQTPGTDVKRDRARYTVLIYGNAGGRMDQVIENTWDKLKPMLDDTTNVRVLVMYKYGKESEKFSGRYGKPNDLVLFELTNKTDLTQLHETSAIQAPEYPLYDSLCLSDILRNLKNDAPADNYILVLWGHGAGYDIVNDRPDNMITRGVLYDETLEGKGMNMYQFADALATSSNLHFQCLMFHNCLMGNIETLTEVQQYADYFFVSSHVLLSFGDPVVSLVDKLKKSTDYDFENTAKDMFVDLKRLYDERKGIPQEAWPDMDANNLDFKIIRSDDLIDVNNYITLFVDRLLEIYPKLSEEQKKLAMTACAYSYNYDSYTYLIDLKQYVKTVAAAINDPELSDYANTAISYMDESVIQRWDGARPSSKLKEFYLSVMLPYHDLLHYPTKGTFTVAESYFPSAFNRRTGWALWMDANKFFPTQWMYNQFDEMASKDMTWEMLKAIIDQRNQQE